MLPEGSLETKQFLFKDALLASDHVLLDLNRDLWIEEEKATSYRYGKQDNAGEEKKARLLANREYWMEIKQRIIRWDSLQHLFDF